jgi:hypothetical protein
MCAGADNAPRMGLRKIEVTLKQAAQGDDDAGDITSQAAGLFMNSRPPEVWSWHRHPAPRGINPFS